MSDSLPAVRTRRFYLTDMIEFAGKVLAYTADCDQTDFENSELHYDATLRNLELIGEAAMHVPQAVRDAFPSIPWRQIIATRDRLIHGYLGIDNDSLWSIIRDDIPPLLENLNALSDAVDSGSIR